MYALNRRSGILTLGLLFFLPSLGRAQTPPPFALARRADDFVESIGVATHWGYPDTPYGFAYETVKALLAASGIRYVRDGQHPRLTDLYVSHGIRATVIADPGDASKTRDALKAIRNVLAMVEGPNEVALFEKSAAYQGKGFPEGPRLWTNDLHRTLKADPDLRNLPIIAPSTGRAGANAQLAPLTAFDYCVMHPYAGGQMPSTSLYSDINNNIADAYALLGEGATLKPIVVTESGYHTALGSNVVLGGAQPGVSEVAQAKYLPRHFAEYFNAGIVRTHIYEFIDEFEDYKKDEREATNAEACFGIVRRNLIPKPAYMAIRNLIALLSEAHWDPTGQQWIRPSPEFVPRALRLSMAGNTTNVHHTLLQKANGDYFLLLWQEVSSFDLSERKDITPPEADITLSLGAPASVTVYRPGTGMAPVRPTANGVTSLTLPVPDEILVVRLSGIVPPETAGRPPSPRVSASATRDSATISWQFAEKERPAAVFVTRLGRLVGTANSDEKNGLTDTGLLPGKRYLYQVVACDNAGRLSAPIRTTVATRSEYADLIVTDVGFAEKPEAGKPVRLTATIRNTGNAPTPTGIVHGVAFSVNGQMVCWSDDFTGPLMPGESRKVTSNAGPKGVPHWIAASGTFKIRATADDVRRLPERTHENNTREQSVTVP
ncbi:MAG: CARDB domain-containing protein [Capsulimonadales bacterium]|nr:CARDB domain-containing protein [Capsulimonadales bacterium]